MWIDTHCHLDAAEFDADRDAVVARARALGVAMMVLPAGHVDDAGPIAAAAARYGYVYALGIHPLAVERAADADLPRLRAAVGNALADPRFVAVGEIGLDFFVPGLDRERQTRFYREQLKLARDHGLPVILHVRRSADALLRELNRIAVSGGIAHAFNGSLDQAQRFVARGFCLGFGGAMTYAGSLRIRRLAATLPADAVVVETDAPDLPAQWRREPAASLRNEPGDLPRIAAVMAGLRGLPLADLAALNRRNALRALPRLAAWLAAAAAGVAVAPGAAVDGSAAGPAAVRPAG